MKRILISVAGVLGMLSVVSCTYAPRGPARSELIVTEVARFETDQCTGVAVSRSGRVFASFPLWHDGHAIHVAEVDTKSGAYWAYPDQTWNSWREGSTLISSNGAEQFICVQAVYVDDLDRLWVLDPASPRMRGQMEGARPKLVQFDLGANRSVRTYFFDEVSCPAGSYLNDVRIDTRSGHAFMTDSSLGGLVLLDLNTGSARRVLAGHPSTMAEPEVVPVVEGRELRLAGGPNVGNVPQVHSDGIALDAERGQLYWQALTARTLYRIPTSVLIDESLSDGELSARIENLGPSVVTDGMEVDERGNVYFSALEHDAVVVRRPDGEFRTLVRSPLYAWPDSFALGPGGTIYFTVAQIHRTSWFTADGSMPTTPYRIFKTIQMP